MSPAVTALLEGAAWVFEHADLLKTVGQALASGSPKEAIQTAIRGVMIRTTEDALREEFRAAKKRTEGSQGKVAFEAYFRKLYAGQANPLPMQWNDVPRELVEAWEAAADAVREG